MNVLNVNSLFSTDEFILTSFDFKYSAGPLTLCPKSTQGDAYGMTSVALQHCLDGNLSENKCKVKC